MKRNWKAIDLLLLWNIPVSLLDFSPVELLVIHQLLDRIRTAFQIKKTSCCVFVEIFRINQIAITGSLAV